MTILLSYSSLPRTSPPLRRACPALREGLRGRLIVSLILSLFSFTGYSQSPSLQNLRCEMLTDPQGIDVIKPRLSWEIASTQRNVTQTAYQLIISSSKEKLAANNGDIWNSGKVSSSASIQVAYAGKPLTSRTACYWKVKVFTNKGETNWSAPAQWTMGLLNKADWKAQWIGYDKASPWDSITTWSRLSARYFRKPFSSGNKVKKATVYVSGLGLYELYINGGKTSDQVLAPNPTDYRKAVLYQAFDVTNRIQQGENVIAAVVGNGRFFTMRQNYKPQKINTFGYPKLLLQLEIDYTDGSRKTIVSDGSWKLHVDGPIRTNNEYDGEEYDATKELTNWNTVNGSEAGWQAAKLVQAPTGKLTAQMSQSMKVMKTIKPVAIKKLDNNVYVLDMGQNFAGWLQLKVQGKKGDQVKLRFAESLQPNGSIYVANLRDAKVTDAYTLKGQGIETWHPTFVFHGFRYAEITGYPGEPTINDFEGQVVYDDLQTIGSFQTSNNTINRIYQNAWWGIASNYKGMPIDCPQRNERQPWLGDRATGAMGESFLFGNASLYAKWLNDIEESQTAEGAIPDVAPAFWNYYSDNITWPGTYILVADMLYRQFGDKQSVVKHYPSMKKWSDYMQRKYMKDYIMTKDKYGDWCVPPESLELIKSKDSMRTTKGELIATAYYYRLLQHLQQFAMLAGKDADATAYASLSGKIKDAFNKKFFNSKTKNYDNNTVTANLLPLYFGITPDSIQEAVFNNVYNKIKIENHMHISTGLIGTQWLMRGLSQFQHPDIAYTLASNTSYPSWGYMAENGATTIWELWNGNTANPQMNSQNHVMLLGDLLIWLHENLAGIRSDEKEVAFKHIIMKPEIIDGLNSVNATYHSPYGEIVSNWIKDTTNSRFSWNITVPANAKATIYIPAWSEKDIAESGKPATESEGVKFLKVEGQYIVFEIASGIYSFVAKPPYRKGIVKDQFIFERAGFPESHAATIAETPAGLITAWFGGTKEGNKDVCIWTSRLVSDQWTAPVKVADGIIDDTTRWPCYNPVLYQVPNGELLLFFKIGSKVATWKGYMIRSKDNGLTWGPRESLPDGFLGPVKNKPIPLGNELWCASSTEGNGWKVHFEVTPDNGKTWRKIGPINDGKAINAIQPSILTYQDGRLQVLCRSKERSVMESWSSDQGKTWSPMQPAALPNNNSGTDAVTLKDGRQLIVYNHVKPAANLPNGKGARTPLNVAVSQDGKSWSAALVLEESPVSQYSYPSVIQTADGMVHIVYTWRRERIKYIKVDPSKLELKPIVNEQWPGLNPNRFKASNDE
jgi:alpha-L-rhamnosidase